MASGGVDEQVICSYATSLYMLRLCVDYTACDGQQIFVLPKVLSTWGVFAPCVRDCTPAAYLVQCRFAEVSCPCAYGSVFTRTSMHTSTLNAHPKPSFGFRHVSATRCQLPVRMLCCMQNMFGRNHNDDSAGVSASANGAAANQSEADGDGDGDPQNGHVQPGVEGRGGQEENAENNPLIQLLLGGIIRPQTPALRMTVRVLPRSQHGQHRLDHTPGSAPDQRAGSRRRVAAPLTLVIIGAAWPPGALAAGQADVLAHPRVLPGTHTRGDRHAALATRTHRRGDGLGRHSVCSGIVSDVSCGLGIHHHSRTLARLWEATRRGRSCGVPYRSAGIARRSGRVHLLQSPLSHPPHKPDQRRTVPPARVADSRRVLYAPVSLHQPPDGGGVTLPAMPWHAVARLCPTARSHHYLSFHARMQHLGPAQPLHACRLTSASTLWRRQPCAPS